MGWLQDWEQQRRGRREAEQQLATRRVMTRQIFVDTYRPHVLHLLHDIGRAWGGVDVNNPPPEVPRTLLERMFGPSPRTYSKGYRVYPMGAGMFGGAGRCGNDFCLELGLVQVRNGHLSLRYEVGRESGGLRISMAYHPSDNPPGSFWVSSTRLFLPPYVRQFFDFELLRWTVAEEWAKGTFVGPYFDDRVWNY